jgi:hypothetical protein
MRAHELKVVALSLALVATIACGGSPPAEEPVEESAEAVEESSETVFEEDFEAGDADQWTATEGPDTVDEEEPATDPDQE